MQENTDKTQLDELAAEGWTQMKDLLQQHGLEETKKPGVIAFWNFRTGGLVASLLVAVAAYTFFLNSGPDQQILTHVENKTIPSSAPKAETNVYKKGSGTEGNTGSIFSENNLSGSSYKTQTPSTPKINIREILQSPNTILLPPPGQAERINKFVMTSYARKIKEQKESPRINLPQNIDLLEKPITFFPEKEKSSRKGPLPVKLYVGSGFNFSGKKQQTGLALSQINVHPSLRIVFPLAKKLSVNTGLYAFSSLNAREASTEEKELVNNVNANLYYTINKSSILKASYFEIPATLNYHLSGNWTAGAGIAISRLYQFNVKETEKNYDYNENITATNVNRNVTISTLAAPATKDKITLRKWDPRMILETTLKTGPFLFSAGYHYGLSPSITISEANHSNVHFNNEYFKIGIQFQMK